MILDIYINTLKLLKSFKIPNYNNIDYNIYYYITDINNIEYIVNNGIIGDDIKVITNYNNYIKTNKVIIAINITNIDKKYISSIRTITIDNELHIYTNITLDNIKFIDIPLFDNYRLSNICSITSTYTMDKVIGLLSNSIDNLDSLKQYIHRFELKDWK